jgi:hypothetical protein
MSVGADWLDHTTGHPISSKNASTGNPIQNDEFFDSIDPERTIGGRFCCDAQRSFGHPMMWYALSSIEGT